jgi:hypothetical protein
MPTKPLNQRYPDLFKNGHMPTPIEVLIASLSSMGIPMRSSEAAGLIADQNELAAMSKAVTPPPPKPPVTGPVVAPVAPKPFVAAPIPPKPPAPIGGKQ